MKSVGLAFFSDVNMTSLGLLLFLSVFLVHVYIQCFVKTDQQIDFESKIPFDGDLQ